MKPHTKTIVGAATVLIIAVAAWCTWQTWPSGAPDMRRTAIVVEQLTWHEVTVDNRPVLYFESAEGDSALTGITSVRDSATHRRLTMGFWTNSLPLLPTCRGRVVAPYTAEGGVPHSLNDSAIVRLCRLSADLQLKRLQTQKAELDYYIRVHGVQDNGYQQIASLANSIDHATNAVKSARHIIDSLATDKRRHHFALCTKATFTVTGHDDEGKTIRLPMHLVSRDSTLQLAVLQTTDHSTPDWAKPAKLQLWNASTPRTILTAATPALGVRGIESDTVSPIIVQGTVQASGCHNMSRLLAPDGAPVYTRRGHFIGVVSGKKIISRREISKLLKK